MITLSLIPMVNKKLSNKNYDPSINDNKKAQAGLTTKIASLIGGVVIIFLVVALAPDMFSEITTLENETMTINNSEGVEEEVSVAPSWLPAVLSVIVGAGLVFMIYRTFN